MPIWKKLTISAVFIGLAGVHLFVPKVSIDGITLILLILAMSPWLIELIKEIEIAGVGKITLQDVERAVSKASKSVSVAPESTTLKIEGYEPEVLIEPIQDPGLALVTSRNEIEKRIRKIVEKLGKGNHRASLDKLIDFVRSEGLLDIETAEGLKMLVDMGNRASHGAEVDTSGAQLVLNSSPSVFAILDSVLDELPE